MGLFSSDSLENAIAKGLAHGFGSIGGAMIGAAVASAIENDNSNKNVVASDITGVSSEISTAVQNKNIQISPRGEYKVVKCPGCGHRSSIVDGDGTADYCEYCGTAIGN